MCNGIFSTVKPPAGQGLCIYLKLLIYNMNQVILSMITFYLKYIKIITVIKSYVTAYNPCQVW